MINQESPINRVLECLERESLVIDAGTLVRCIDLAVRLGSSEAQQNAGSTGQESEAQRQFQADILAAAEVPLQALAVLGNLPLKVQEAVKRANKNAVEVKVSAMQLSLSDYPGLVSRKPYEMPEHLLNAKNLRLTGAIVFEQLGKYAPALEYVYDSYTRSFSLDIVIKVPIARP